MIAEVDRRMPIRREYQALYGVGLVLAAFAMGQSIADGSGSGRRGGGGGVQPGAVRLLLRVRRDHLGDGHAAGLRPLRGLELSQPRTDGAPCRRPWPSPSSWSPSPGPWRLRLALARVPLSAPGAGLPGLVRPPGPELPLAGPAAGAERRPPGGAPAGGDGGGGDRLRHPARGLRHAGRRLVRAHGGADDPAGGAGEHRRGALRGGSGRGRRDPAGDPAGAGAQLQAESPPLVLDVRSRSQYERDRSQIPGSVRVLPDDVDRWAGGAAGAAGGGGVLHLTERGDQRPCGATAAGQGGGTRPPCGGLRRLEGRLPGGAGGGGGARLSAGSPRGSQALQFETDVGVPAARWEGPGPAPEERHHPSRGRKRYRA